MRIAVEVKGGTGGVFGGDSSSTSVTLDDIADYEVGAATVAVMSVLQAHGIGDGPDVGDGDDASVGTTEQSDPDPEEPRETPYAMAREEAGTKPGACVRLTFDDGSTRLFIDTGMKFQAPSVEGRFVDEMLVEYDSPDIRSVDVVYYESER